MSAPPTGSCLPDWADGCSGFRAWNRCANGACSHDDPSWIRSAKVEIMASKPHVPLKLAPSELTESMLVPLVNQFGLMQQQMFDQFQQAMAMMVQMFGTMHRDQMEVIRAELRGSMS